MGELTHLKSIGNGRVFLYSKTLAERNDMIPCDAEGSIPENKEGEASSIESTQIRKATKYLGNTTNGVLYPYTKFLAQRSDMVSIDTEEQWEAMKKSGKAPEPGENVVVPVLSREPKEAKMAEDTPVAKTKEEIPAKIIPEVLNKDQLPNIEGMGARESKKMLSDWAKLNFGDDIDQRQKLGDVIIKCRQLIFGQLPVATGM